MMLLKRISSVWMLLASLWLTGCASTPPYDYSALIAAKPRSILVILPMNQSLEVNAPYVFLSTISRPLGEKGYYVFPVAVIDNFLKENGLPTPGEMNQVPLDKLRQHIGADAVLYTDIQDWGQKYNVLSSDTVVKVTMRLVDARTGVQLWDASASAVRSSDSGGGLLGKMVVAVASQIVNTISDQTPEVSRMATVQALYNTQKGLLNGPYRAAAK